MAEEIWKDTNGFPGYQVSSLGRVKNARGRILEGNVNQGYLRVRIKNDEDKKKLVFVHRLVANAFLKKVKGKNEVDHINNNKLDNTKFNLRYVNRSENMRNIPKRENASSIYIGVYIDKKKFSYRAKIKVNGKYIHLGYFVDEDDAAKAYNNACDKYKLHTAKRNIIEGEEDEVEELEDEDEDEVEDEVEVEDEDEVEEVENEEVEDEEE